MLRGIVKIKQKFFYTTHEILNRSPRYSLASHTSAMEPIVLKTKSLVLRAEKIDIYDLMNVFKYPISWGRKLYVSKTK